MLIDISGTISDFQYYTKTTNNELNYDNFFENFQKILSNVNAVPLLFTSLIAGSSSQQNSLDDQELGHVKLAQKTMQKLAESIETIEERIDKIKKQTPSEIRQDILKDAVVPNQLVEHFLLKMALNSKSDMVKSATKHTYVGVESVKAALDYSLILVMSQAMGCAYNLGQKTFKWLESRDKNAHDKIISYIEGAIQFYFYKTKMIDPFSKLTKDLIKAVNPIEKIPFALNGFGNGFLESFYLNKADTNIQISAFDQTFFQSCHEILHKTVEGQINDFKTAFNIEKESLIKSNEKSQKSLLEQTAGNLIYAKIPKKYEGKFISATASRHLSKHVPQNIKDHVNVDSSIDDGVYFTRSAMHAAKQLMTANLYSASVWAGYGTGEVVKKGYATMPSSKNLGKTSILLAGFAYITNSLSQSVINLQQSNNNLPIPDENIHFDEKFWDQNIKEINQYTQINNSTSWAEQLNHSHCESFTEFLQSQKNNQNKKTR